MDGFSSRIKPEAKDLDDEEEEGIGDVDLFTLAPDRSKLTVNAKWLHHLQVRLQPRMATLPQGPTSLGLCVDME